MSKLKAILLMMLLAAASPPLLQAQVTESYTFAGNRLLPDGNASGLQDVRSINSAIASIASLKVRLRINGEFNGDLYAYVRHSSGFSVLLNRPGKTASNAAGYDDSGLDVTFAAGAANGDIHVYRNLTTPAAGSPLTGTWQPDARITDPAVVTDASSQSALLSSFNGLNAAGDWTLYLVDLESGGTNMLSEWGLEITGTVYPAIAWANPADIVYGVALGPSQLNAAVTYDGTNVAGAFTYTPAAGTVLNAGPGQLLSVSFTPADNASFLPVGTNVTINVLKALTAGAVASSANPAPPGTLVTFTMTVTAAAGPPAGTVKFRIDGNIAGSGTLSGGVATYSTDTLALGSHTVVAEYAGDMNFIGTTNALSPDQVINTPPVAGADTIERYPTQGVKVRLSTLLANDSDADGDTLSATVSSTSANGGTITVSDGWVSYSPPSGFTNVDSFTYTITDGRGGSATATVIVAIKVDNDPGQNLTITDLGGGQFRIRGSGIPGRTYRLQYTDELTPANWQNLANVTADSSGVFEFTDGSGSPTRFYRTVYP